MASKIKWYGDRVLSTIDREIENNMERACLFLEGVIKTSLKQTGTGRTYDWEVAARGDKVWKWIRMPNGKLLPVKKRATPHIASAPNKPPATDKGQYSQSINHEVKRKGKLIVGRVGTGMKIGKWLEFGTRHMAPRPHFRPAFKKNLQKLIKIIAGKE